MVCVENRGTPASTAILRTTFDQVHKLSGSARLRRDSDKNSGPRARLTVALNGELLDNRIDVDLSVTGLTPALHLPMLAGLAQGPGFPNLSCLGLLSDRVLRRYVPQPPVARAPAGGTLERSERV